MFIHGKFDLLKAFDYDKNNKYCLKATARNLGFPKIAWSQIGFRRIRKIKIFGTLRSPVILLDTL